MKALTKEDLHNLLMASMRDNEKLRFENERLLLTVVDATARIKKANETAETYQLLFNELIEFIRAFYDPKFMMDEAPNLLN